jgi:LruC domain-containing protein
MKKMRFKQAITILAILLLIVGACTEKDYFGEIQEEGKSPFGEDVKVSASFNWQAVKKTPVKVIPLSQFGNNYNYEISIYDYNPYNENAKLLTQGYASTAVPFTDKLVLPGYTTSFFVKQSMEDTAGTLHTMVKEITLEDGILLCDFTNEGYPEEVEAAESTRSIHKAPKQPTDINVPSNATVITGSSFATQRNGVYVLPEGSNFTGQFNWSDCRNTTIYIMGTFSPSNIMELNNSAHMYIGPNASVTTSQFTINSGARIENQGSFTSNMFMIAGPSNDLKNYGQIEVQTLSVPANAEIKNYCYLTATTANLQNCNNVILGPDSYTGFGDIKLTNTEFKVQEHAILDVSGEAFFISRNSLKANPNKAKGLVKMNRVKAYWGGLSVKGTLEVYIKTPHNYNSHYIKFDKKVNLVNSEEDTMVIDPTGCNGSGNNSSLPPIDPNPTPGYPLTVVNETAYTYLFEDLWPYLGDFDMNDLIMSVNTAYDLSDATHVSALRITAKIFAVGSARRTACAIQLDGIAANAVESVTDLEGTRSFSNNTFSIASNGIENNQTYAVIPITENAHKDLRNEDRYLPTNTYMNEEFYSPKTYTVEIKFASNRVTKEEISQTNFNVFVVQNVLRNMRRKEIHLSGYNPSDLASSDYFNKGDDRSRIKPYTSANNLVWGILVANTIEAFQHAQERIIIQKAFPLFVDWITTQEEASQSWYLQENANDDYLYTKTE